MTSNPTLSLAIATVLTIVATEALEAATCESLSSLKLADTRITTAQPVARGPFTIPSGPPVTVPTPVALSNLPAFCRVTMTLTPTTDSDIKVEVWLPSAGWNGKLQSVGNGAWAGVIPYPALASAISDGYAGAATDTGHVGNTATFVPGHLKR